MNSPEKRNSRQTSPDAVEIDYIRGYYMVESISFQIEEDDVYGYRHIVAILPLPLCLKPFRAIGAHGKMRYDPCLDITVLIYAPGNKKAHYYTRSLKPYQDQ